MDLPGHGAKPGDLATATIGEWVDSVVADIEEAGLGDIVIVGHSMAGVTVPGVVAKLGSARVREMILATAFVPPQGEAIVDTLGGPLAWFARRAAKIGKPMKVPKFAARYAFCNGMTPEQRRLHPVAPVPGVRADSRRDRRSQRICPTTCPAPGF